MLNRPACFTIIITAFLPFHQSTSYRRALVSLLSSLRCKSALYAAVCRVMVHLEAGLVAVHLEVGLVVVRPEAGQVAVHL